MFPSSTLVYFCRASLLLFIVGQGFFPASSAKLADPCCYWAPVLLSATWRCCCAKCASTLESIAHLPLLRTPFLVACGDFPTLAKPAHTLPFWTEIQGPFAAHINAQRSLCLRPECYTGICLPIEQSGGPYILSSEVVCLLIPQRSLYF